MIRSFASLRRRFEEPGSPELQPKAIEKRFRNPRVLGHNLEALLNELLEHFDSLESAEVFPNSTRELVTLHGADSRGTAFRYSGQLPDIQESLDFPDLAALLDQEFTMLGGIEDALTEMYAAGLQPEDEGWY